MLLVALAACGRLDFDPVGAGGDCASFALADAHVNLSSHLDLPLVNARAPVTFVLAGPGAMLGTTATFVAPAYRSTTQVTATDAAGCVARGTIETGGDVLFYIAGTRNGIPVRDVWRGTDPLTWAQAGSVPAPRVNGAAAVFHDAMWLIGGSTDESATGQTNVWRSTDGVSWTDAPPFPVAVTDADAVAYHDRLWVVGGHGNQGRVWSSAEGASWTNEGTLPVGLHGGQLVVLDDRLVYLGGHDDTTYYDTEYASTDGATWSLVGRLPSPREFQSTTVHDGTILFAGGTDAVNWLDETFHGTDGAAWVAGGTLPAPRLYGRLRWIGDRYYDIGGTDGGDIWSTVDGASWQVETSSLPHPRYAGGVLEFTP